MNRLRNVAYCLVIGLAVCAGNATGAEDGRKPLRFGSVAMDIPAVMQYRLTPLTEYLSRQLKRPVILTLAPDMATAIKQLSNGTVDMAYLTPVAYIRSHAAGGARLIVKTVTEREASFRLMIVVRADSPIRTVADLAGKRFAFGDEAALLQRAVVVGADMPLQRLGEYQFLGHYDNIVRGVLNRDYDAGIVKDTMAYKWEGRGIRVVYRSPELPPYNVAVSNKVSAGLGRDIRSAFLRLRLDRPADRDVIQALDKNYTGFASTDDAEYNIVRRLIKPFRGDK